MSYTSNLAEVNTAFAMLQKYSVEPASQPEGYARGATKIFKGAGDFSGFRHEVVGAAMLRAYVSLTKNTANTIQGGGTGAYGALLIKAKIGRTAGMQPTYYLPWDHRGAAVEMTIAPSASLSLHTHPQIFFTTALSGCSVVFKGTAQSPTIYHCGSQDLAMPYDANQFWRDFVDHIDAKQSNKTPGSQFALQVASEATKSQYVSGIVDTTVTQTTYGSVPKTTQTTIDFRTEKSARYGDQIAIEQMIPWGAVFGIRRGTDWTFYLQENVNLIYYTQHQVDVVKKHLGGLIKKTKRVWQKIGLVPRIVSRPMQLRQVFPGAGAVIQPARFKSLVR